MNDSATIFDEGEEQVMAKEIKSLNTVLRHAGC